jgi:ferredoxin-NADP reductase
MDEHPAMSSAATTAFDSRLVSRQEVAERTLAFYFEKPAGWTFKPGQTIDLTLPDPSETDAEGHRRTFSVASHPHEELLMVATRMRNTAFKRALGKMPVGSAVKIDGPFGNLTLHNKASRAAVILTGGIGITPFRSIALHAAKAKLPHKIVLFYSNRRPEDAAFLEELQALQNENPNYRLVATMTQWEKSRRNWQGEKGQIDEQMLSRHAGALNSPIYYVAGPPGMVTGLRKMLNATGVDDDDIRTEEFPGY